jgi:hypothetical protein
MDFNARIDDLEERVAGVKASVNAAANETHEQLSKRIDKAHTDAGNALNQAKQDASAASDKAKDSWDKAHADAQARVADLKAKAQRRRSEADAKMADTDADWAEVRRVRRDRLRGLGGRERPIGDPRRDRRADHRQREGRGARLSPAIADAAPAAGSARQGGAGGVFVSGQSGVTASDVAGRTLGEQDQQPALRVLERDVMGDREDARRLAVVVPERQVAAQPRAARVHRIDVEGRAVVVERSCDGVCAGSWTAATSPSRAGPSMPAAATSWRVPVPGATTKIAADSMSSTTAASWTTAVSCRSRSWIIWIPFHARPAATSSARVRPASWMSSSWSSNQAPW